MPDELSSVWVFQASNGRLASAVFPSQEDGENWIRKHKLSGIMTKYPVGVSIYDWAVGNGYFKPKDQSHSSPEFIGRFTSAHLEHYHYVNGEG